MKKRIFAVCDQEAAYAYGLMEYIYDRQGEEFEVHAFTSVKSLCSYAREQPVAVLLISAQAMCREVGELSVEKVMILSEGELLEELSGYPAVYKYQASDSLIAEVMGYYAEESGPKPSVKWKRRMELIGIYSPVRRTLKTSFALALGQILARDKGVLYLNLEDYAGFEGLMGKKFKTDLSDLMYFVKQGRDGILYQLQSIVQNINNLDYIPPVFLPGDLRSVTMEEWKRLFAELSSYSSYEILILDMDGQTECLTELLDLCGRIYMPIREDGMSLAKLDQYEQVLKIQGREEILHKTRKLKLPFHSSFGPKEQYVEQLVWGEFGDYVRGMIREEERHERRNPYNTGMEAPAVGEPGSDKGDFG